MQKKWIIALVAVAVACVAGIAIRQNQKDLSDDEDLWTPLDDLLEDEEEEIN